MQINVSATPLISLSAIVIDTETTGLNVKTDRIIQLGGVRVSKGKVEDFDPLNILINPEMTIPPSSEAIHGISNEDVAYAKKFEVAAKRFSSYIEGRTLIGHNIGFDLAMLEKEYQLANLSWFRPRFLDTSILTRIIDPVLPDYDLETIASWLGTEVSDRHSAVGDAQTTAQIFIRLIPLLRSQGVGTLAEAEHSSRSYSDIISNHVASGWVAPDATTIQGGAHHSRLAKIDSFPFRVRVQHVMRSPAVFISADTSISSAAQTLIENKISSTFVSTESDANSTIIGPQAVNSGIVTERDLMRLLTASDVDPGRPVSEIMSAPLNTIHRRAFVYQAIGQAHRDSHRHLAVVDDDGRIVGALTTGDLLRERANDALILGFGLEIAGDAAELGTAWSKLPLVVHSLSDEGVGARDISAIISEQICAATMRAGQLAEQAMLAEGRGRAPAPYALMVLGSAGRGESLLKPDQDNALIYELEKDDNQTSQLQEEIDQWFADFGTKLAKTLNDIGIAFCQGGVMVRNQKWRHSQEKWRQVIENWFSRFHPEDLLYADIFFDMRPVLGDKNLAENLWKRSYTDAARSRGFLSHLSGQANDFSAAVGVFGQIKTTDGFIDLKKYGLFPVVSGARALSLKFGIVKHGTVERLEGAAEIGNINRSEIQNAIDAHEIIVEELLKQQIDDLETGVSLSNRVNVGNLTHHRKNELKWAFRQIEILKALITANIS